MKSLHQKLLRMQKRHSLWSVYGIPAIYTKNGIVFIQLRSGMILDLRNCAATLIMAINPSAEEKNHYEKTDCVNGQRIFIEKLTKYDKEWNIEYRILTMNGWEHS